MIAAPAEAQRSGRLITGAAAIMVSVFAAFGLAEILIIKAIGLGMALAVAIDATLVRSLLLPSLMKLLGEWNWWMPGFLRWIPRITIEGEPERKLGHGHDDLEIAGA